VATVVGFKHPALKQLTDQQVRFAPPTRRREQQARAEKLLTEIDPAKRYPYQYVCFRITDFRPESYPDLFIDGDILLHDLPLLIAPWPCRSTMSRSSPWRRSASA
jgi:RNA polymerase primary sigma factor